MFSGKKLFECPDNLMELTMAVNTISHFYTTKAFLPAMMEENHGHIVTIASMAGKMGASGLVDYCASKHGAVGFHESLTTELIHLRKNGIKTTVVCPYYVDTPMLNGATINTSQALPILKSQDVVDNIMDAVLTNRTMVLMPKFFYFMLFALR
ncbi:hypothetical protein OESDEN_07414 [Oesophagostomum dentatum]|uniref:Oxidoreductase, short chain dehydrogenase/reductase family protein n=1 Tax=Oesophagostomum dentatum TaxID=61180 RepID=A0A0B1T653_OESDE|nr:hypothetical protein OESDEN_07414 [Oesophagostomum dentatum]